MIRKHSGHSRIYSYSENRENPGPRNVAEAASVCERITMALASMKIRIQQHSSEMVQDLDQAAAMFTGTDENQSMREAPPSDVDIEICKTVLQESEIIALVNLLEACTANKSDNDEPSEQVPIAIRFQECSALYTSNPEQGLALARALGRCTHVCLLQSYAMTSESILRPLLENASANLKSLRIEDDRMRTETVKALAIGLESSNSNLKMHTLRLSRSKLSDINDFPILAKALKQYSHLKRLEMKMMGLADRQLANLLTDEVSDESNSQRCPLPAIESLGVSFNRFQDLSSLGTFLIHPECRLRVLSIGYASSIGQTIDISSIAEALGTNKTLRTLKLPRNRLKDSDALLLAKHLDNNTTLETLDVRENFFTDVGIAHLAEVARGKQNPLYLEGLRKLKIARNPFGMNGSLALLEAASQNFNLVHIDVSIVDDSLSLRKKKKAVLDKDRVLIHRKILYHTALNRGGRRMLLNDSIPLSLLPMAMERSQIGICSKRKTKGLSQEDYYNCIDVLDEDIEECDDYSDGSVDLRSDVLYLLLKENATAFVD